MLRLEDGPSSFPPAAVYFRGGSGKWYDDLSLRMTGLCRVEYFPPALLGSEENMVILDMVSVIYAFAHLT